MKIWKKLSICAGFLLLLNLCLSIAVEFSNVSEKTLLKIPYVLVGVIFIFLVFIVHQTPIMLFLRNNWKGASLGVALGLINWSFLKTGDLNWLISMNLPIFYTLLPIHMIYFLFLDSLLLQGEEIMKYALTLNSFFVVIILMWIGGLIEKSIKERTKKK